MRIHIKTYGCTLNQADSDIIGSILKSGNNQLSSSMEEADVVIVNTCTVKNATSQKILYQLSRLQKSGKKVLVTGCMAGANQDMIEKYAPAASIVTTSNIPYIAEAVEEAYSGKRAILTHYNRNDRLSFFDHKEGTIAKIPVSDGCLSSCSFCETKSARGPLNSFEEAKILNAIRFSAMSGAKEMQLTSQDMGAYGFDRKTNVAELMSKIASMDGDFKVRVGMLNPEHLGKYIDRFSEAIKSDRFYKFVHIPVQSGSDIVLRDMRRLCSILEFEGYVKEIRQKVPGITIETDLIVGFPTESEKDFELTMDLVKRLKPEVTNISKFGARPHADASKMEQLAQETINSRSARLSRVVRSIQHEINDGFVGNYVNVIVTEETPRSFNCRTESYKQVVIRKEHVKDSMPLGSVQNVMIYGASSNVLYGKSN